MDFGCVFTGQKEQVHNLTGQKIEFPLMSHFQEMWGLDPWSPGYWYYFNTQYKIIKND